MRQPLAVEEPFVPPDVAWRSVSPKLVTARRIVLVGVMALLGIGVVIVFLLPDVPIVVGWLLAAAWLLILGWLWWLIGRRVRSYGYAERGEDLLVTSGILFRRLVIVPYGRMQLVDVVAGPLDRALGVATVKLHTAAATTDATIPGLPPDEAGNLRDRLTARGEERSAGL